MGSKRYYSNSWYQNAKRSDAGRSHYEVDIPPKPKLPIFSQYGLSEKVFNRYENNPSKLARHHKVPYLGCLSLFLFGIILLGLFIFLSEQFSTTVAKYTCIILGIAGLVAFFICNKILGNVTDYECYKRAVQQYEKDLAAYNFALSKKEECDRMVAQERERAEREKEEKRQRIEQHQRDIQDYITGRKRALLLSDAQKLLSSIAVYQYRTAEEWMNLSWREFELEVGDVYRRLGYQVKVTQASIDKGVDIVLHKDNQQTLVQCKHYGKGTHVGAPELRSFCGVCVQYGAKGEFVCTSYLTKEAQKYIEDVNVSSIIKLVSLNTLIEYDIAGARLVDNEREDDNEYQTEILYNLNYIDCHYYMLYTRVYPDLESAIRVVSTLKKYDGKQYAILPRYIKELNETLYYITIGDSEAIRQLGRKVEIATVFPQSTNLQ